MTQMVQKRQMVFLLMIAALLCAAALPSPADVLITEFMASNDSTILDGNGASSDWVELHNTGASAVDLTGWYLSDDDADPQKWRFPATNIAAGGYLLVFASGANETNYVDSLGYLHTTYRLSRNDGEQHESVVLVHSDGVTVIDAISDYPEQSEDVSYGPPFQVTVTPFVLSGSDARALVPNSAVNGWNNRTFDDSGWLSGTTGVGYERDSGYESAIGLNVGSMWNQRPSVYVRVPFTVADAAALSDLAFRIKYDDGFAAYINGVPVASNNVPPALNWNSQATASHEANLSTFEGFTVSRAALSAVVTGTNVLAVQGLNRPVQSSDLLILPELRGVTAGAIETNNLAFMSAPTPGAPNVSGVEGYVADTTFTVDRGFFSNAFDVAIACETADAEIYYSTDGSTPTPATGQLYAGPIHVDRTTVLRAAAYKTGYAPSDVDTQTYIFLDDVIRQPATAPTPDWPAPYTGGGGPGGGRQAIDYEMDPDVVNDARYSGSIKAALLDIGTISLVSDLRNFFDQNTGIYMNPQQDGAEWERDVSVELLNPDGSKGFQIDGGIRIRGGMSRQTRNPKHSFRLFFRTEYGTPRLEYELFEDEGVESFKRLDLRTGQNFSWALNNPDYSTWLYDIFSRDSHREMGQPYTRGRYYHVYINGAYWGLYQSEERPDARFGESYFGDDSDDYDTLKSDSNTGDMYAADGTMDAYNQFWTEVNGGVSDNADYFRLQGKNPDGTDNHAYTRMLDVDNLIDYMLLVFYTGNRDMPVGPPGGYRQPRNLYVLHNRSSPSAFRYIAHDCEHSLEVSYAEGVNINRVSAVLDPSFANQQFFIPWWLHLQLTANTEYKTRLADRTHRHFFNNGVFTADAAAARLNARKAEIDLAVIAESARWGDYVSPSAPRTRDDTWLPAVNEVLNNYILATPSTRTEIVLQQLKTQGWYPAVTAPVFAQHGGLFTNGFTLTVSASQNIYYTLDGSDPRAIGGSIAGSLYDGPIPLTRNTLVKARARNGSGTWSALTEAVFTIDTPATLRVTEIMYHPAAPDIALTNLTENSYEFIELLNTGTETVGLAGLTFTNGIRFDFTEGDLHALNPGEYVLLVQDLAGFTNRYTNWHSMHIAGEFSGRFFLPGALDDAGESLALSDATGREIQRFRYDDDWHELTDGEDFSLTLLDPQADTNSWNEASAWRASAHTGGTPGTGPEAFIDPESLVINEVLSHQDQDNPGDWVELYNAGTDTLDINGWFISDDEDNPTRVIVSNVPAILPGAYAVLTEHTHFGTNAVGTNGFALSELGDSFCLTSATNGSMTGYRQSCDFMAAARDITYGRHTCRDGTVDFAPLSAQTSGDANATPLIGPVVIGELHYHPPDSNDFEFIELHNTAVTNVPLYDTAHPTNTWSLDGAIAFSIPTGIVMSAGEYLLVVPTNAAAFTNRHAVPAGTRVLGPYDGRLDNAGETLYLCRPGTPDALTGQIPRIPVEWVAYDDAAPWPTGPDGGTNSLERVGLLEYANDSVSWAASSGLPTPGAASVSDDQDGDGIPDAWEIAHFGSTNAVNGNAGDDYDGDGADNYDEWFAGTDPTNAASVFAVAGMNTGGSSLVLTWSSEPNRFYRIWAGTDLSQPLGNEKAGPLPATPPENTHTVAQDTAPAVFYRISVEK